MNRLTKEEQRELASKGGKASVEARRRKKSQKQALETILSLKVKDSKAQLKLSQLGIKKSDMDNQMLMLVAVFLKACKGDVRAAEYIRGTLGEDPILIQNEGQVTQETNNTHIATLEALQS
jgi:hypothetical protein